jgi:DNA-binding CsgD family transcriptional regulator
LDKSHLNNIFKKCCYLSEILDSRDSRRITAAEVKYMRRTAGYIWTDCKTNRQIARELKITPILKKITGIQEKLDTICK